MKKYNIYLLIPHDISYNGLKTFVYYFDKIMRQESFFVRTIVIKDCVDREVGKIIKNIVANSDRNIFIVNFWPASIVVSSIRKYISSSKIVQVVHDLPWLTVFNGETSHFVLSMQNSFENIDDKKLKKFLYYSTADSINTFNCVDRIICLCEDTYNVIKTIYGIKMTKVSLIRNAIPDLTNGDIYHANNLADKIKKQTGQSLLFIGRPTISKGWDRIIKLAEEIKKIGANYKIICAGSDKFTEYIPKHLCDIIKSLGVLNHGRIMNLIKKADGVLIPSRHEQCSYVGIESLMFGKEIFIFGGFGIQNVFKDRNSHKIENFNDILISMNNPKGQIARLDYLKYFTPSVFRDGYLKFINSLYST